MNSRIRELAYTAELDEHMRWTSHEGNVLPDEMIKFAELIVLECANLADTAEPYQTSDLIKQHFGLTE